MKKTDISKSMASFMSPVIELWGIFFTFLMMIMLAIIFFAAYFQPTKTITIGVDLFKATDIEVAAILFMAGFAILGQYITFQRTKKDIKFLEFWGIFYPLGITIWIVIEFIITYYCFPSQTVLVAIDYFHEANIEAIVVPVSTILATLGQIKIAMKL
jgi:hypothetical protein